jgi:hypothetical protein
MLTARRDYLLRIIDEVTRLLARVILKRRGGDAQEALHTLVQACERLFGMEGDKLFQFTPEQHYLMLTQGDPPDLARNKVLVYAALNQQAAEIYAAANKPAMARASLLNSLRLTLRAQLEFGREQLPDFTPNIGELRARLGAEPLDAETQELLDRFNAG